MLVFIAILFLFSVKSFDISCNSPNKICIRYPEQQFPSIEIALETNGSHMIFEIYVHKLRDGKHVAVGYSKDSEAGNDFVVYCGRNENMKPGNWVNMGIEYNSNLAEKQILGNLLWKTGEPYFAEPLNYTEFGEGIYCRLRHNFQPIFSKFNTTKGHLLISRGPWKNRIDFPSRETFDLGFYDFANSANKKIFIFIIIIVLSTNPCVFQ